MRGIKIFFDQKIGYLILLTPRMGAVFVGGYLNGGIEIVRWYFSVIFILSLFNNLPGTTAPGCSSTTKLSSAQARGQS